MRLLFRCSGIALVLVALGISLLHDRTAVNAAPAEFEVNSTDSVNDGTCDVTHCSLAEAIALANANSNPTEQDLITFAIPGDGPHIIAGPLPAVTQPVRIDGSSQEGTVCAPEGRTIVIEIRGPGTTGTGIDFNYASSVGSELNGVALTDLLIGVRFSAGSNHTVRCTNLGASAEGDARSINTAISILSGSSNGTIGGSDPADRNVIVSSSISEISVATGGGHLIQNNWIGVLPDGVTFVPTTSIGINVANSSGNTVKDNVIMPHPSAGVRIVGNGGSNVVQGNLFGYFPDGVTTVSSSSYPIVVYALNVGQSQNDNIIGGVGVGEGNRIFTNAAAAIQVLSNPDTTVTGNTIRGNSVRAGSSGRAIALLNEGEAIGTVTPNDPMDPDGGTNLEQNFPVVSDAVDDGSVTVTLNSTPNTVFTVDIYAGDTCSLRARSLQRYVGSREITTNGSGDGLLAVTGLTGLVPGEGLKATATDTAGNTSEASVCRTVTAAPVEKTITDLNPDLLVSGSSTRQMSLIGTGLVNGDVVKIDGVDAPTTFISATELEFTITAEQMDVAPTHFTISIDGATNTRLLFLTSSRSDADCSGVTTAADALMVLNILAGLAEPPKGCSGGDANNSSAITLADAIYIRLDLVGLVEPIAEII